MAPRPAKKVEPASKRTMKPKTTKGLEIGDTGTRILSGIIREEYNPKLRDRQAIDTYDEMRRSDASVKAALMAVTLPIRAASWYVKPASDDAPDKEVSDFVQQAMFEWQTLAWEDLLRQALLSLPFGFMVFEKVFATRQEGNKTYIVWDKFAPRVPRSIYSWAIGDGLAGVTQWTSDGKTVEMPWDKLIVITNEREGDNFEGISILRAAYKHWFLKNTFYKIDAIAFERQGLGIPFAELPDGATSSDRTKAEEILKNIRANSQAYAIIPEGYKIGFLDMNAKSVRDPQNSIAHHNREILKSVLAQFLELGAAVAGASGSRAVSSDHSQLFLQSIQAVADNIASAFRPAIKELVDLNFDDVTKYPELTYSGINEADPQALATAYSALVGSGAVIPTDNDEQFFRKLLTLPNRDPEDPGRPPKQKPANNNESRADEADMSELVGWLKKKSSKHSFAEDGTFEPYREMTDPEGKVDFPALQAQMDRLEEDFVTRAKELLHGARADYMKALTKAALAADTQAIKNATLKVQADYARIIKQAATAAYAYGKTNAAKEMGVEAPANSADVLRQIDIQSDAIAEQQIAHIAGDSKNALVQALNKGTSITAALAAADQAAAAAIEAFTTNTAAILIPGYVNHGRKTVFDTVHDGIYAFQRSEILDAETCNFCLSVDGRIVAPGDDFVRNTIFHSNCRGIWVAIMKDEAELPPIGGIPQAIRDRFGDAVNDLIQPKAPIVSKGSPAAKEAAKRIERQNGNGKRQ